MLTTILCMWGFIHHKLERHSEYHQGRRVRTEGRQPDPAGWGYWIIWYECKRCKCKTQYHVREGWEQESGHHDRQDKL